MFDVNALELGSVFGCVMTVLGGVLYMPKSQRANSEKGHFSMLFTESKLSYKCSLL